MKDLYSGFCLVFLLGRSLDFPQDSRPSRFSKRRLAAHRIGDRGPIYTNLGHEPFAAAFEVVVGPDGKVMSAQTSNGFISDLTPLCKTWRYKPLKRNGQPVAARVTRIFTILPIRELTEVHVPFPEIHDWNSCGITLIQRAATGCVPPMSSKFMVTERYCTTDKLTSGPRGSKRRRSRTRLWSSSWMPSVEWIILSGRRLCVWGVTDMPTYVTSISFDGMSKSVWIMWAERRAWPRGAPTWNLQLTGYQERPTGSNASKAICALPKTSSWPITAPAEHM